MSGPSWDGPDLLGAMRQATANLKAHVDEVNALNVFPVPDGDTGSNMLATIQAAYEEAETVPPDQQTVQRVSSAIALGALMGARGNSGVILSQLFRGISESIHGKPAVDGQALAESFERGCTLAFAAVAHPVEGTILSVARAAAESAAKVSQAGGDLEAVLAASTAAATEAVARTPDQLAILRQAGVVDAGGRGLELLLLGALAFQRSEAQPAVEPDAVQLPSFDALEEEGFGYETVYVVMPFDGVRLDPVAIRAKLDELGESVLVAGDERAIKIHVHNERPDLVIAYGLTLGSLTRVSIENLDRQAEDRRKKAALEAPVPATPTATPTAAPPNGQAALPQFLPPEAFEPVAGSTNGTSVIAVAQGPGLARLFGEMGVAVVEGGQRANPSAGELVAAIRATGSREVILLPNNSNVRLAAKQAGELLPDVRVNVVPTRNAAEGVAALLALDTDASAAQNVERMTRAGRGIQTLQVTAAVRDARIGRKKVRRGEHIVLDPDDGLLANGADRAATIVAGIGKLKPGFELLTLYYGDGMELADAEELAEVLGSEIEDIEVEIVEGGQPHYSLIVAAE